MKTLLWLALLPALLLIASSTQAVVPGQVAYQGLLLDDLGAPITATVSMDFELFDAPTLGNSLWTESHPAVQVVDGVYEVTLGATSPITPALISSGSVHLEISVDAETLVPRQQLLAVPYAHRADVSENTEQVNGFSAEYVSEMLEHFSFDGQLPDNLDPSEGLADVDGDGVANFADADNDGDGIPDGVEFGQSDINLVTPTITGFSPTTADGFETTLVQVQGTNFAPGLAVSFGTENPTPTNLTATSFDVMVGPQPEGIASVSVTLPNAENVQSSFDFFFLEPTITGFSPTTADGFETTLVQVQGTNFAPGMAVSFGTENPTPTNLTATSFDVMVGPQPEGTASVSVTLPNAKNVQSSFDFFFLEPSIDTYSPERFDQGQAGTITITGQNFISGMTVQFGAQAATPTNITPTSFDIAVTGTEPPGFVTVTITLPNGEQVVDSTGFEVNVGSPRVIFATAVEYTGNLGGLVGADATCQASAQGAGLPGTFLAWLADGANSPSTRDSRAGAPYVLANGPTIASDWADLTDGTISTPINRDQNGSPVSGELSVWTNVAAVGAGATTTDHCGDWTNGATGNGAKGLVWAVIINWTEETNATCSSTLRLYCIQQ